MINRRRQQAHHGLEWRMLARARVAARRHERLGPAEAGRQLLRLPTVVL